MSTPRVVPSWRHGQERLYVFGRAGDRLAWYDRDEARVSLLREEDRERVLMALGPFLAGEVSVGPPPVPSRTELSRLSLHPDDDLAPNRPGETLRSAAESGPRGRVRRLRPDPLRRALAAEEAVGAALDDLEGAGVLVLHSVPLPGGDRIHHLLIGPGGLFAVHTLAARRQRVRVADPLVAVGRARPEPLLDRVRSVAYRASFGLAVEVRAVLVPVEAAALRLERAPRGMRVEELLSVAGPPSFATGGGVLKPADIASLYALARDRRTWLRV
ncbi:nuclease-related domain-containing protein [Streptomyces sp. NPDC058045]|uniref:nuclease-related domain-containing protein n=1 Tax=Streptomyces sp. NPDC058045 TaxID=3346311 RepID=UPI0036E3D41F